MIAVIVAYAEGRLQKSAIEYLLTHPDPDNFSNLRLVASPPQGLYLVDVVYDPKMFTDPVPYIPHIWDEVHDVVEEEMDA